jgi:hypothetical protein
MGWFGERYQRGAEMAVEDLNAKGGVLGHSVELIAGGDFCDADQAMALARNRSTTASSSRRQVGPPVARDRGGIVNHWPWRDLHHRGHAVRVAGVEPEGQYRCRACRRSSASASLRPRASV